MTRAETIRKAIKVAGKPLLPREIVKALGLESLSSHAHARRCAYFSIREMLKDGILDRVRTKRGFAYFVARDLERSTTPANGRRIARRRQRQVERAIERQQFRAARVVAKAKPKPVKPRHIMPVCVPSKPSVTAPPKPVVRFESVDAYLARGGRIQRIPPGRMAESVLRFEHGARA